MIRRVRDNHFDSTLEFLCRKAFGKQVNRNKDCSFVPPVCEMETYLIGSRLRVVFRQGTFHCLHQAHHAAPFADSYTTCAKCIPKHGFHFSTDAS